MKLDGDAKRYVSLHLENLSTVALSNGTVRLGTLPDEPHYAVVIDRDGSTTAYRGPIGQITDKFFAEYRKR